MKMFNDGWLVKYGLVCAGLLLGANVSAQISDWSAQVIGGTACNAQETLNTSTECPDNPDSRYLCGQEYDGCNQQSGNATQICQEEGGTVNSCTASACNNRDDDTLSATDAAGVACVPTNI